MAEPRLTLDNRKPLRGGARPQVKGAFYRTGPAPALVVSRDWARLLQPLSPSSPFYNWLVGLVGVMGVACLVLTPYDTYEAQTRRAAKQVVVTGQITVDGGSSTGDPPTVNLLFPEIPFRKALAGRQGTVPIDLHFRCFRLPSRVEVEVIQNGFKPWHSSPVALDKGRASLQLPDAHLDR